MGRLVDHYVLVGHCETESDYIVDPMVGRRKKLNPSFEMRSSFDLKKMVSLIRARYGSFLKSTSHAQVVRS